jgi:hypothetical protein
MGYCYYSHFLNDQAETWWGCMIYLGQISHKWWRQDLNSDSGFWVSSQDKLPTVFTNWLAMWNEWVISLSLLNEIKVNSIWGLRWGREAESLWDSHWKLYSTVFVHSCINLSSKSITCLRNGSRDSKQITSTVSPAFFKFICSNFSSNAICSGCLFYLNVTYFGCLLKIQIVSIGWVFFPPTKLEILITEKKLRKNKTSLRTSKSLLLMYSATPRK